MQSNKLKSQEVQKIQLQDELNLTLLNVQFFKAESMSLTVSQGKDAAKEF